MCDLFGAKKAAKISAAAMRETAAEEARQQRLQAQAAVSQQQTMIAQSRASDLAAELLNRPTGQVDVTLTSDASAPVEIDPVTKRRKTTRAKFMSSTTPGSGIKI